MTFSTLASPGVSLQGGSGSGGGTPGGSTTQIQYNNAGAFAGASGLTTDGTNLTLGSASQLRWSTDLFLTRRAAANLRLGAADTGATTSTVTITIAAPGVVTWSSHGFSTGTPVVFTTTGALPTGITAGTTYYAVVIDANTFQIASSVANAIATPATVITTSGTQSGTHTGTRYNITQRLGMQSVTGVTDRLGADLIIQGSQGTGTGAGGSIVFQVAPAGLSGPAQNALATALTISGAGDTTFASGKIIYGSYFLNNNMSGVDYFHGANIYANMSLSLKSDAKMGWGATTPGSTMDVTLFRDAANTLALRNGANAQELRVYGSYTSASVYDRLTLKSSSTVATIAAETDAGDMDLALTPAGSGNVQFGTHAAVGAETVTGYITIKDAGGTLRKLAVIS